MTLLNYTDPIPLPPPTAATTAQFYTDPLGDVWVAINTVQSGAWLRARGNLFCRAYRLAAYTLPASPNGVACPFDTAVTDNYKMFTAPSITVPIGGLWMMGAIIELGSTAVNQVIGYYMANSRSTVVQTPGTAFPLRVAHTNIQVIAANAIVAATFEYTTASLVMVVGDTGRSALWAYYMGT